MAHSKHFYKMIKFTLLTNKLFIKVHNLESMFLVHQQPQVHQVSQSRQVSQLTISCQTCIVCYLQTIKKLYNHTTIVKSFQLMKTLVQCLTSCKYYIVNIDNS